ncbi:Oxidoreductase family, NAD-binding Rossmann fold [Tessaracoccus bendigoensis DSM 12906]|uniref:Oxidoreductase family, NAD-binding Rossmann fold n=1 Tax=Tessaracoccus bendigoensis DSM 12906 TaxID=1123357 RepID=A0A1M6ETC2_9ACTN|nr:Gfo/Idh/MocA family oxidoreductase [Tessaracoccus bendigoensis]SHI88636.1 Oxidoreductase family, NAD-binding Rossmann fold [Tessaracoccus bendigoensis DSM 12906]
MRIALMGAGLIGSAHAARLDAMPRVEELLVADFVDGRAAELAEKLPKARAVSVNEAFGQDVDGVVITAKTAFHADLIHRALDAGIPALARSPSPSTSVRPVRWSNTRPRFRRHPS